MNNKVTVILDETHSIDIVNDDTYRTTKAEMYGPNTPRIIVYSVMFVRPVNYADFSLETAGSLIDWYDKWVREHNE